ncbi:MAG: dihydrodipicolinate synthase family protein, partial [Planctomycetota bacterium]|nr:dihydrodipicolinate synthase family protein [Planctomycetota bacterium]
GLSTNPIPIKAAMQMVGRDTGEMRLPMTPLEAPQFDELREALLQFGLTSAVS